VDLYLPIAQSTSARDDVADVLDYDLLRLNVSRIAQSRHFNLQETLIDEICAFCLQQPAVKAVRVVTQKPDVYPDCKTVGIEVIRWAT
jgi:dihydroneopterin aldolase